MSNHWYYRNWFITLKEDFPSSSKTWGWSTVYPSRHEIADFLLLLRTLTQHSAFNTTCWLKKGRLKSPQTSVNVQSLDDVVKTLLQRTSIWGWCHVTHHSPLVVLNVICLLRKPMGRVHGKTGVKPNMISSKVDCLNGQTPDYWIITVSVTCLFLRYAVTYSVDFASHQVISFTLHPCIPLMSHCLFKESYTYYLGLTLVDILLGTILVSGISCKDLLDLLEVILEQLEHFQNHYQHADIQLWL